MAEAADSCALTVIQHCQSHRLLPLVCSAVCTDRNAKLRQQCAVYLLQVITPSPSKPPSLYLCREGLPIPYKLPMLSKGESIPKTGDSLISVKSILQFTAPSYPTLPLDNLVLFDQCRQEKGRGNSNQAMSVRMQVLQSWEGHIYEAAIDSVERALLSACQDALSETRATARQMFGAFAEVWPHRIHDLLEQLQPNVQAKMIQAITAFCPGISPTHHLPCRVHGHPACACYQQDAWGAMGHCCTYVHG
jgi:hypothetical protein